MDSSKRYVCFILVRYSDTLIADMRRLSKGAKVTCKLISFSDGILKVLLSEVNGISVKFSSADVVVIKNNRFAGAINYFIWEVPQGSETQYSMSINPVQVCMSRRTARLDIGQFEKSIGDYMLGADISLRITLKGFDEVGRGVSCRIEF